MSVSLNTTLQLDEIADDLESITNYRIFPVILESVLFALYTVLMIFHCIKYRKDRERVLGIFAVSICLFAMCAAAWVLDIWILALELTRLLPSRLSPENTIIPIDDALKALDANIIFARSLCSFVIYVFCDSISLWRAYVIYGKPRWLRIACCTQFTLSFILYLMDFVILRVGGEVKGVPSPLVRLAELSNGTTLWVVSSVSFGSTLLSQVSATALIARKVMMYRKEIQDLLPARKGQYHSQRLVAVLFIVVETGLVYSLLWVVFFVSNQSGFGLTGWYYADFWMCQVSGMYPTLIVVIVSQQSSLLERSANNASGLGSVSIHFAANDDAEASGSTASEKHLPDISSENDRTE